jgi:hypothetical protein
MQLFQYITHRDFDPSVHIGHRGCPIDRLDRGLVEDLCTGAPDDIYGIDRPRGQDLEPYENGPFDAPLPSQPRVCLRSLDRGIQLPPLLLIKSDCAAVSAARCYGACSLALPSHGSAGSFAAGRLRSCFSGLLPGLLFSGKC